MRAAALYSSDCAFLCVHKRRLLKFHTERVLPFIYTPTVGEACKRYFELMQRTKVGVCHPQT